MIRQLKKRKKMMSDFEMPEGAKPIEEFVPESNMELVGTYSDIHVDLETLSTRSDAAIVQIGLVAFDLDDPYKPTQKVRINCRPHPKAHINPETIYWWMKQNEAARQSVFDWDTAVDPASACTRTTNFINHWHDSHTQPPVRIWAMPAKFDITILENLYGMVGFNFPWLYNSSRDVRTVCELAGLSKEARVQPLIEHDAAEDAAAQTLTLWKALAMIRNPIVTVDEMFRESEQGHD